MIPQAQLWMGPAQTVEQRVITHLQQLWCDKCCGVCTICQRIARRQYQYVCWIKPGKQQYVKADLDVIMYRCALMLEEKEQFFFIVESADLLSPVCANSLLKLIEEPPRGYHFIFCVERLGLVLPTIVSRCVVTICDAMRYERIAPDFMRCFTRLDQQTLSSFMKIYENVDLPEHQASLALDEILLFWCTMYRQAENAPVRLSIQRILDSVDGAYRRLPLPGSGKLFWRNLLVQLLVAGTGLTEKS